jgi:hypothetical protein
MLPRPPEALVRKLVPLLCKIVGIASIIVGSLFLVIGIVLLFTHAQNSLLIGAVFVGGSIFQIAIGFVITRFFPGFMLGIFESLRQKQ